MKPWSSGKRKKRERTRSWRRKGRVGAMLVTGQVTKEGVERGRMTLCFPAGTQELISVLGWQAQGQSRFGKQDMKLIVQMNW